MAYPFQCPGCEKHAADDERDYGRLYLQTLNISSIAATAGLLIALGASAEDTSGKSQIDRGHRDVRRAGSQQRSSHQPLRSRLRSRDVGNLRRDRHRRRRVHFRRRICRRRKKSQHRHQPQPSVLRRIDLRRSTGRPRACQASIPPANGRTRLKPRSWSFLATIAADASFGQSQ